MQQRRSAEATTAQRCYGCHKPKTNSDQNFYLCSGHLSVQLSQVQAVKLDRQGTNLGNHEIAAADNGPCQVIENGICQFPQSVPTLVSFVNEKRNHGAAIFYVRRAAGE